MRQKTNVCFLTILFLISLVAVSFFAGEAKAEDVILSVEKTKVASGCSASIDVSLYNPDIPVDGRLIMNLVDEDDYLSCTGCALTNRWVPDDDNDCTAIELGGGECFVDARGIAITTGDGPIIKVTYDVNPNSLDEYDCKSITIEVLDSIRRSDGIKPVLTVCKGPGKACFTNDGDVYPPGSGECSISNTPCVYTSDCPQGQICEVDSCGDCVIEDQGLENDQTELLKLSGGVIIPNDCQEPRADMPTATPPDCVDPDGEINIEDVMVLIDKLNDDDNCIDYLVDYEGDEDYVCGCEADFNCDGSVDAQDVDAFVDDFGRNLFNNPCTNADPCNGDFNCDRNVDAQDIPTFLDDFGRNPYNDPCPPCEEGPWCSY